MPCKRGGDLHWRHPLCSDHCAFFFSNAQNIINPEAHRLLCSFLTQETHSRKLWSLPKVTQVSRSIARIENQACVTLYISGVIWPWAKFSHKKAVQSGDEIIIHVVERHKAQWRLWQGVTRRSAATIIAEFGAMVGKEVMSKIILVGQTCGPSLRDGRKTMWKWMVLVCRRCSSTPAPPLAQSHSQLLV